MASGSTPRSTRAATRATSADVLPLPGAPTTTPDVWGGSCAIARWASSSANVAPDQPLDIMISTLSREPDTDARDPFAYSVSHAAGGSSAVS